MHLLQAQPGEIGDGVEPVDPGQTPADVIVLSAADTELALLSEARAALGDKAPSLRLASLDWLRHPYSVDLYLENTALKSSLVVARILGGEAYWPYGLEQFSARLSAAGRLLQGRPRAMVRSLVEHLEVGHFFMPPWAGTPEEAELITAYLASIAPPRPEGMAPADLNANVKVIKLHLLTTAAETD